MSESNLTTLTIQGFPRAVRQVAKIRAAEEDMTLRKYIQGLILADVTRWKDIREVEKEKSDVSTPDRGQAQNPQDESV